MLVTKAKELKMENKIITVEIEYNKFQQQAGYKNKIIKAESIAEMKFKLAKEGLDKAQIANLISWAIYE